MAFTLLEVGKRMTRKYTTAAISTAIVDALNPCLSSSSDRVSIVEIVAMELRKALQSVAEVVPTAAFHST